MTGFDARDREIGIIYDFLGAEFPDALMKPATIDPDEEWRLHSAGLGMAEIIDDAYPEPIKATYVRDLEHPAVIALRGISAAENHDLIPIGSHDLAIDLLVLGQPGPLDEFISRQSE